MLETLVSLKIHYGKTAVSTEVPQKSTIRLVLPKKINAQDLAAPQLHKFRLEASNPQIIESIKPTLNLKNNSVFCRPHGLWTIMHVKTWTSEFRNQLIDRILSLNK